jgi:hypothetical protein
MVMIMDNTTLGVGLLLVLSWLVDRMIMIVVSMGLISIIKLLFFILQWEIIKYMLRKIYPMKVFDCG